MARKAASVTPQAGLPVRNDDPGASVEQRVPALPPTWKIALRQPVAPPGGRRALREDRDLNTSRVRRRSTRRQPNTLA